jgi:hypothetical protein
MHNYTLLKPIDNTDMGFCLNKIYQRGVSEYNRLFYPNQGEDEEGNIYHYLTYGAIKVKDMIVAVNNDNIFLKNGFLTKPGVIVHKKLIKNKKNGVIVRDQLYFRVLDSNIESVKKDNLIIIIARSSYRFNYNKEEFFYVPEKNILLIMNENGHFAGPGKMILKDPEHPCLGIRYKTNPEFYSFKLPLIRKGSFKRKTYYYKEPLYRVIINEVKYHIVWEKDIKVIE